MTRRSFLAVILASAVPFPVVARAQLPLYGRPVWIAQVAPR